MQAALAWLVLIGEFVTWPFYGKALQHWIFLGSGLFISKTVQSSSSFHVLIFWFGAEQEHGVGACAVLSL